MPNPQTKVVEVPNVGNVEFPASMSDDQIATAIRSNYSPQQTEPTTAFTDTSGKTVYVPRSQRKDAIAKGYKVGPANQQRLGGKSTVGEVAREGILGLASGAGIPESQNPVGDLLSGPFKNSANPEVEGFADGAQVSGVPKPLGRILGGIFSMQKGELDKSGQAISDAYHTGNPAGYAEGAIHGVAGLVPIIGPASVAAGTEIGEGLHLGENKPIEPGKIAHGVGQGAGTVLQLLSGTKGGQAVTEKAIANTIRPAMQTAAPAGLVTRILSGGEKAMAKAPLTQQTAAGAATNADVAEYAASKGIDLLPGQATGSRGLKSLQAIGERAVVGGEPLETHLEGQRAAFADAVDDFRNRTGNTQVATPEDVGLHMKKQAQTKLDALKASAQKDYQSFQRKVGDVPVDLTDVSRKYSDVLASQAEALNNLPTEYAAPVRNILNKLANIKSGAGMTPAELQLEAEFKKAASDFGLSPGQQAQLRTKMGLPSSNLGAPVSMSTAQQLRSAYLDLARDFSGNIPTKVQKIAGQAAAEIDAAMEQSAQKVHAAQSWRQANSKWKQLQQTYNDPESPLYQVIAQPNGQAITQKLLARGQYGGDLRTIKALKQQGLDLSPVRTQIINDIADKNFAIGKGGKAIAGYSDNFLKEVFPPDQLDELKMLGRVGRAINFEMNPSGTSNVTAGERQLHGIIARTASAVTAPVAAKITMSQAVRRAATGIKSPPPAQTSVNPSIFRMLTGGSQQ